MELKSQVLHQINRIEKPEEEEEDISDWLNDALDIQYIVNQKKEYLGARILVTFGGPNIWVDTQYNKVEGYWGTDTEVWSYEDNLGIDAICQDLFECS